MSTGGSKRAVAEIRFGEDRAGVAKVGGRSIHQYWSMLSPHFRDVFLAPQRRSDDGGVSWTWREPAEQQSLTAAELAGVRNRLERAKESFEENPVSPLMSEARGGGASSQEIIDQLMVRVKALAEGLAGKPDAALAEFVCRTETGVMVHSWGLNAAAKITYPDSQESAVSGIVLFGGKGSAGNDVVIDNARGLRVARTTTDEAGGFSFPKLAPGRYRVRVISGPGEFSNKGVSVTVERGETSRIELRSTADPEAPASEGEEGSAGQSPTDTSAPIAARKRRMWTWAILVAVLFLLGGGGWMWRSYFRSSKTDQQATQRISTLTPEKFSSGKTPPRSETPTHAGGVGAGLGAVVDRPGETQATATRRDTPAIDVPSLSSDPGGGTGSRSVSKIGTRVELSGINTSGASAKPLASSTNASRGAPKQSNTNQASMESPSGLVEQIPTGAEPDSRSENDKTASATIPKKEDDSRSLTGGAPAETLSGHLPAGAGGSMPESPAGSEAEKNPGMAVDAGLASDKTKSGSNKAAGLPVTDRVQKGGSSGEATATSSDGGVASASPGAQQISGQGPVVAVSVVEKPANRSRTPVVSGDGKSANPSENISSSPSSPGDSATLAGKPSNRKDPKAESKASAPASHAGSDSSTVSPMASSAAATNTPGKSESDENGKGETPATANEFSAASSSADVTAEGASDKTSASPSDQSMPEKTGRPSTASGVIQSKPLPPGMQIIGSVKLGEWSLRIGRDAIVPTLPLRDGEADQAETLRRKMSEEQKARLPATLKRPQLLTGFAFKFAVGAKPQPLLWSMASRSGLMFTAQENRAEVVWTLESALRESVFTLAYPNGAEVARIEFDRAGRATVAVKPELRAVFLLGAMYAEADRSVPGNTSRIAWQVVRGPLASTAWTYDSRWQEGAGCRLEVVLNGANPANTMIALVDPVSGWQLATELE